MKRRAITNYCAIPAALFLVLIGILHSIVNVSGLRRVIERGEIPKRLSVALLLNAAFSGIAISLLGTIVLLFVPGLRAGDRKDRRVATTIGIFVAAIGAGGYLWVPTRRSVLI